MKTILLSASLCLALAFGALAQDSLKPTISIQPLWGPTGFNLASYYYLPDIEAYYDVPEKKFIYPENGKWVFSPSLPQRFQSYDLYSGYKVVLNRPHAYYNFKAHRSRYAKYKGQLNRQVSIKDSTNPKYFVVEGHPRSLQLQSGKKRSALEVAGN